MLALGTTPRQVMILIGLESLWLTTIGAAAGCVLGIALTLVVGRTGIDLSSFIHTAANFMVGTHVVPRIDWTFLGMFVLFVVGTNTLVSLYPAWRAGRLAPLDSMRRVG
jgi:lipoprotein-releasing system permease protein